MKPFEFTTYEAAERFTTHCIKLHAIILGDNEKYWVVNFRDAQRLTKQGYELAE